MFPTIRAALIGRFPHHVCEWPGGECGRQLLLTGCYLRSTQSCRENNSLDAHNSTLTVLQVSLQSAVNGAMIR